MKNVENVIVEDLQEKTHNLNNQNQVVFFTYATIVVSGITLTLIFFYLSVTGITQPLNALVDIANEISSGQRNVVFPEASRDETGILLIAMKQMLESIVKTERALKESESRYRLVAEGASDGLITIDEYGKIFYANRASEKIFGYHIFEMIGKNIEMLVPENMRSFHLETIKRYIHSGKSNPVWSVWEFDGLRKDGIPFPMEISFGEYVREQKSFFTGIYRDITERKQAEDERNIRVKQQSALMELSQKALTTRNFMTLLDDAMNIVSKTLNTEYCSFLEFQPSDNAYIFKAVRGWQNDGVTDLIKLDNTPGGLLDVTCNAIEPVIIDAEYQEPKFKIPPIFYEHGFNCGMSVSLQKSHGHFGVLVIHTQRFCRFSDSDGFFLQSVSNVLAMAIVRLEQERISVSREQLARVGEISAGVAHSIRNPVHGAINCAELLKKKTTLDSGYYEMMDLIIEALERIGRIAGRLLRLARNAPLNKTLTNLDLLIKDVLKFVEVRARDFKVKIHTRLDPVPDMMLDADHLAEAIINLVNNSIDACSRGGEINIEVLSISTPSDGIVIKITDTGVGIPTEYLSKVLDPFFTTKPVGEGTGLGLAITKRIVEDHGGEMTLESIQGKGVTIRMFLPARFDNTYEEVFQNG
ncbi:MAG: PAS domain S-box protein [SAR324 cluster bacterium]|nr:PAS domain S-box protein [SAR324 cluster bacterium]